MYSLSAPVADATLVMLSERWQRLHVPFHIQVSRKVVPEITGEETTKLK